MRKFVDQFPHVCGQFGPEKEPFADDGMGEAKLGSVKRLAPEFEPFKQRAQRFGRASIDRVPQ